MHLSLAKLCGNVRKVFLGHDDAVKLAVTALLARGHLLIEDVPGVGKTLLARALAQSLDATFRRIQFTPDLLPADITGVSVFDQVARSFEFVPGPVFGQIVLADEINRSSPRTQSALLETMEERQVTVDGETRPLPEPFLVIATQNPIELGGTYPLPEAQVDRFLLRLELGYPEAHDEARILDLHREDDAVDNLGSVLDAEELSRLQREVRRVGVSATIRDYIVAIAGRTRDHEHVTLGVSPRGSLALMRAAQAWAFLEGNSWVSPDDVKRLVEPVLSHRVVLDPQRELTGLGAAAVLADVLDSIPVPVVPNDERAARL